VQCVSASSCIRVACGAVLAVGAFAAGACSRSSAAGVANEAPIVAVVQAATGDVSQVLTLGAEFRPFQEIEVHAKVAGYLKTITVDVGDRVNAGQLLAILEVPELQDELRQDDAAVRRSAEDIHRAQADLERAEFSHEASHLASARLASVAQARPHLIAQQDLDEAASRDRVAEAQVATAKAAVAAAEQQLEASKANQSRTHTLFAYSRITAPFTGVITHRYADTGAMIQAGTSSSSQAMPLVRLSQNDRLRLTIPVPESAVSHIHVGAPVDVGVASLGRTFAGTVARFSDSLNHETRTMSVEVDVPNARGDLVPGMYATASLALDRAASALVVPVQAIDRSEDKATVVVVRDGKVERRDVRLGLEAPDRVQVVSGLRAGELVVVGNRGQLRDGMIVTPAVVDGRTTKGER
jgi:RND family efflux transporter MFP subunit